MRDCQGVFAHSARFKFYVLSFSSPSPGTAGQLRPLHSLPLPLYSSPMPMPEWLSKWFGGESSEDSALGDRAENLAARHLRNLGYKIIVRNYMTPVGEIDIICRDADTLVFVEVKSRTADNPAPEDQVNQQKQHQITKAAKSYLSRYGYPQPPARFDVVAVVWPKGGSPEIRHTKNAFEATF